MQTVQQPQTRHADRDALSPLLDRSKVGGVPKRTPQPKAPRPGASVIGRSVVLTYAMLALLAAFAVVHVVAQPHVPAAGGFADRWHDAIAPFALSPTQPRASRVVPIIRLPRPEAVEPPPPPPAPTPAPPDAVPDPPIKVAATRHERAQAKPHDICRGRGRTWTKNGKSWRCNRPGQRPAPRAKKRR